MRLEPASRSTADFALGDTKKSMREPPYPETHRSMSRPLLLIDVDGVISLFGFDPAQPPPGKFQMVDGIAHLLSATTGEHLGRLSQAFEPVWCTGWEEKANDYLPHALGLPGPYPYLSFDGAVAEVAGHWKLAAIDQYAGPRRPVAWIDDAHDER